MYTYRLIYPKSDKWFFTTYYYRVDSQSQPSLTRAIAKVGGSSVFWYARFTWCALTWVTWIWHFEWIILFPVKKPGNYNHSHKFTEWYTLLFLDVCDIIIQLPIYTVWDDILIENFESTKKSVFFFNTRKKMFHTLCVVFPNHYIYSLGIITYTCDGTRLMLYRIP